jgi:hypothetical protein
LCDAPSDAGRIFSDPRITGLLPDVIAELVIACGSLRHARHQARSAPRPRKQAIDAGPKHRLVFVDRLLAVLIHRHGATQDVRVGAVVGPDPETQTR